MKPKEARRAWARFLASASIKDRPLYIAAEYVRLSIEELILNSGKSETELKSRENLARRFATFAERWTFRRG